MISFQASTCSREQLESEIERLQDLLRFYRAMLRARFDVGQEGKP